MPFLKLESDKKYDLTILSEAMDERERHWIAGKMYECTGPGCKYCVAEFEKRKEWLLTVEYEGEEYRWSFPETVATSIKGSCPVLKGSKLTVCKTGTGPNTRYQVAVLGASGAPVVKEDARAKLRFELELIMNTLRSMADDLEELIKEGYGNANE